MLEIILAGGWLMAPILLCSTLSVAIIIERFWTLRRSKVTPEGLGAMVEDWAARHELDERHLEQIRVESPLGRIYAAALINRKRPRDVIKEVVEDTGRHVVHDLERFLNTLGTIAGGISHALITTAAGVTVAMPSYFFYRFFQGMVSEYVISMEEKAISLIDCIERGNSGPKRFPGNGN